MSRVSVAIPTFNGEKYIQETLQSILNQTRLPVEIVVSDDGSMDGTVEKLKSFALPPTIKLKVLEGAQEGISRNYLNAVAATSGDIVIIGDQDDTWAPERIETVCRTLSSQPEFAVVSSDSEIVDSNLLPTGTTLRGNSKISQQLAALAEADDFAEYLKGLRLDAHTLAFVGTVRELIGKPPLADRDDVWFEEKVILAAMSIGRLAYIPDTLTLYRQHDNQHTAGRQEVQQTSRQQCSRSARLQLLADLLELPKAQTRFHEDELVNRQHILRAYLTFIEDRSVVKLSINSLQRWLANLVRGKYSRFTRRSALSFLKDGLRLILPSGSHS